ncbi:MAG: hypothetical protein JNM33_17830 [Rubrivivax sp.]|nr:hypothetical protein [Rubrivivax sp.]
MTRTAPTETLSPEAIQAQRASVAVGVAPLLVLLAFTAVVSGLIDPDLGVAIFAACTAWVVYEMYRYQDRLDAAADEVAGPLL